LIIIYRLKRRKEVKSDRRDAEAVSKLEPDGFSAPEGRRKVAPGEALFASPGLAGKLGMSPERAIEKGFSVALSGLLSNSESYRGFAKSAHPRLLSIGPPGRNPSFETAPASRRQRLSATNSTIGATPCRRDAGAPSFIVEGHDDRIRRFLSPSGGRPASKSRDEPENSECPTPAPVNSGSDSSC